jgi:serine protease Do
MSNPGVSNGPNRSVFSLDLDSRFDFGENVRLNVARSLRLMPVLLLIAGVASAQPIEVGKHERRTIISEAVERVKSRIVNLRTMRTVPARPEGVDSGGRIRGLGTGVLIDPRGYIVTNYHVVEKVDEINALLDTGREHQARIVAVDPRNDLALVKITTRETFPYLPLYCAGTPIVGETVIVIGNPYGLENSVTTGIVSQTKRELRLPNGEIFRGLIQTDASINPGNSGGPLLNINGEMMGINVAIRSNAQGIGFAIPTDSVREIVQRMIKTGGGEVEAPMGIVLDQSVMTENRIRTVSHADEPPSARVASVVKGSAADSVLKAGDVITAVAGRRVFAPFDLHLSMWDRVAGEPLEVTVRRDGKEIQLKLRVEPIGGKTDDLTETLRQRLGIEGTVVGRERVEPVHPKLSGGLLLSRVRQDSPADQSGFKPGDILVGLNDYEINSAKDVRWILTDPASVTASPVEYVLIRDGELIRGRITLPKS